MSLRLSCDVGVQERDKDVENCHNLALVNYSNELSGVLTRNRSSHS